MPNTPTDFLSLYQVGQGQSTSFALKFTFRIKRHQYVPCLYKPLAGYGMECPSGNENHMESKRITLFIILEKKYIFANLCLSTTSDSDIRKL